jgi:hypothetical protein
VLPLLSIPGELERLIADHLYPYRFVITPIVIAAIVGIAFYAYRLGLHLVLWRHRTLATIAGAPLLVVAIIAGDYLVSPLWERSHLIEASPLDEAAAVEPAPTPETTTPELTPVNSSQPRETHRGQFAGADDFHFGRGDARLIKNASGGHTLRFENFSVRNGPDLFVYLTRDTDGKPVDEKLNLGKLKATDGAFNYEIPSGIDVSEIKGVAVWCKQFSVLFALAPLNAS